MNEDSRKIIRFAWTFIILNIIIGVLGLLSGAITDNPGKVFFYIVVYALDIIIWINLLGSYGTLIDQVLMHKDLLNKYKNSLEDQQDMIDGIGDVEMLENTVAEMQKRIHYLKTVCGLCRKRRGYPSK